MKCVSPLTHETTSKEYAHNLTSYGPIFYGKVILVLQTSYSNYLWVVK